MLIPNLALGQNVTYYTSLANLSSGISHSINSSVSLVTSKVEYYNGSWRTFDMHFYNQSTAAELTNVTNTSSGRIGAPSPSWAGYVTEPEIPATGIVASWIVQSGGSNGSQSSQWAGIGGVTGNGKLIQAGTESNANISCARIFCSYYAWYELYPPSSSPPCINLNGGQCEISSMNVQPGDRFFVYINLTNSTGNDWSLLLIDMNQSIPPFGNMTYVSINNYGANRDTAEFIDERANVSETSLAALGNFSIAKFGGQYTSNFSDYVITNYQPLTINATMHTEFGSGYVNNMYNSTPIHTYPFGLQELAQTGPLTSNGTSFEVYYANNLTARSTTMTPIVYSNQQVRLNSTAYGGYGPFSYQWFFTRNISNDTPLVQVPNGEFQNITTSPTLNGSISYVVRVNDSRTGASTFSYPNPITVLSTSTTTTTIPYAPPAPVISPSSASVDQGQGLSFRAADGSLNGINRALWQLWNRTAGTVVQGITTPANATAMNFTQVTPYYNTTYSVSVAYLNSTNATITNRTYSPSAGVTVYPRQ